MYSTYNEGKSIITERFIRTLKNKIDKYMTSISKNVYIDKLADIVNKYNNTYHSTIKMKPVDVESNKYIDSSKKIYNKDCKYKIGDIVSMSKYKNIFAKGSVSNWSEEVFVIKKVKNVVPWTHVINDLTGKLLELFTKKNGKNNNNKKKTNQREFRIEKVIKRRGDKLYLKWKGYNNSQFNNWIDKKDSLNE